MFCIDLRSPAFDPGSPLPPPGPDDPEDGFPPLEWGAVPIAARELVLTCEDLDAPSNGPSHHWIVYAISPSWHSLREGASQSVTHGRNDFGHLGFTRPLPPGDHGVHRYRFQLTALDVPLAAPRGLRWRELQQRMCGHVIATGSLIGTWESH